jgi:hypothetical protein
LLATLPLVRREIRYVNLARMRAFGPGDLELRGKVFLWEDRAFSPRHLLAAVAGARLPTTRWARDWQGAPFPPELQVSNGAVSPLVGLAYAHFHFPWSAYASVEASAPVWHQPEFLPQSTVRMTASLQRQVTGAMAVRLGIDGRLDGHTVAGGNVDPDTGGAAAFVSPALLVTPVTDVVIFALVRVPTLDFLAGQQSQGPVVSAGVVYDF